VPSCPEEVRTQRPKGELPFRGAIVRPVPAFERIPYSVSSDQVKAEFENGVLNVILPKAPQQEKSRRI
jgi:HSP20 family molecular chaperone IbpA